MPRHILTGAPGAGKTVILRGLERAGLAVVEEAATDVIAWRHAFGDAEPWTRPGFTAEILDLQLARERRAGDPVGAVVFDRSPVCTLALARFLGHAPPEQLLAAASRPPGEVYEQRVFFIEGLDFITPTAARRIGLEEARRFAAVHEQVYAELGFDLVRIPPAPVAERVAAILRFIKS
jgi:predicted ATPase